MTIDKNNILDSMVWVTLQHPDDFLKVKETLTRIGVASRKEKRLYQSCHILHKQGKYAIVHFKELFALDGRETDISSDDIGRRNTICNLLQQWGLVSINNPDQIQSPTTHISQIKVIPFKEKEQWDLEPKYSIGKKLTY